MSNEYQIQISRRGVITLPKELREQNNITEGDVLNLFKLSEDVFIISKRRSKFRQAANNLAKEWEESGETLESMLSTLRKVRADYDESKS